LECLAGADAGDHQELGRLEGSGGEDYFLFGSERVIGACFLGGALRGNYDSMGDVFVAVEDDLLGQSVVVNF